MKGNYTLTILALSTVPLLMVLGNSMLIPVLPDIQKSLDVSKVQAGLLITAFSVPAGIAILFAGALSDRIGRKKVIIPAMLLYGAGGILGGLAAVFLENPFGLILGSRILQGIGAAGTAPVAMALAGDLFKSGQRSKAMGTLEASNGMGKVISPIAGAALGILSWKVPFFAYGILSLPFAAAVGFLVKEKRKEEEPPGVKETVGKLEEQVVPQLGTIIAALLTGTIVLLNLFGFLFYLSEILETQYKLDGVIKGLVLAGPVLVMATTSYLTGLYLQKHRDRLRLFALVGTSLVTLGILASILIKGVYPLYASVALTGLGNGLILPGLNLFITSAVRKEERGMLTSTYGSVRFMGVALGPPAFGFALGFSRTVMLIGAGALAALSMVVAFIFFKPELGQKKSGGGDGKAKEGKGENSGTPQAFSPQQDAEDREAVSLYLGSDPF